MVVDDENTIICVSNCRSFAIPGILPIIGSPPSTRTPEKEGEIIMMKRRSGHGDGNGGRTFAATTWTMMMMMMLWLLLTVVPSVSATTTTIHHSGVDNHNIIDRTTGHSQRSTTTSSNDGTVRKVITLPLQKKTPSPRKAKKHSYPTVMDKINSSDIVLEDDGDDIHSSFSPRHRQMTATTGEAQQLDALYQGYGTHYVDLWCGTPPQRQTLIVVTGVSPGASGFPCSYCGSQCSYHHVDRIYQETESSTFEQLTCNECLNGHCITGGDKCQVGMSYPEGSSWRGYEAKDKCYIGGPHDTPLIKDDGGTDDIDPNHASYFAFSLIFSCQTKITGFFDSQMADGILSMDNSPGSFWWQMHTSGQMSERKFTLCFRKQKQITTDNTGTGNGPDKSGTHAGAMTLGGIDARLHTSDMVMTVLDTSSPSYAIQIRKIHIRQGGGGDSAQSSNPALSITTLPVSESTLVDGSVLVDSGYTYTYLNTDIFNAFLDAYKELTGNTYSNYPKSMSEEERDALPTLIFQLVGDEEYNTAVANQKGTERGVVGLATQVDPDHPYDVLVAVPPSHYMELTSTSRYAARLYDAGSIEETRTTLGANFIMGHDVLFDIEDERLGWAESPCDYTELVEEYYDGDFGDLPSSGSGSGGGSSIYDNDDDIIIRPIPVPGGDGDGDGDGDGTSSSKRSTGGFKRSILLILVMGVIGFVIYRVRFDSSIIGGGNGRGGGGLYSDLPTELELTDRDDEQQEMSFYRPPASE